MTDTMNRYALINPSDDYEFEAPDDEIAEAMVVLLSGMAGWRSLDDEERQGGFADLAHRDDGEQYADRIKTLLADRAAEVAAALRSLEIQPERRKRMGVDPAVWHDEMRTSLSDYRAEALRLADAIEAPR